MEDIIKVMPKKSQKTAWISVCVLGGIILLAIFTSFQGMEDTGSVSVDETVGKYRIDRQIGVSAPGSQGNDKSVHSRDEGSLTSERDAFVAWAVASLKNDLGETIGLKSTQATLLKLRMFLAEKYPNDWSSLFRDIVQGAFPEKAAAIFDFIDRKDRYNQWYEDNKDYLATLDYADIKGALRAKQVELFGEDSRNMGMDMLSDVMGILGDAYGTSIHKKLSLYTELIRDNDDTTAVPGLDESKFYMTRAFFRMDSVQENLKHLSESEREQTINSVRLALGYSEEDIEKLALIDAKRDEIWQNGYEYMAERSDLTMAYEGDELDRKLYDLQERYFGSRALTIRAEEASGFFRFQRPRIYGSN